MGRVVSATVGSEHGRGEGRRVERFLQEFWHRWTFVVKEPSLSMAPR